MSNLSYDPLLIATVKNLIAEKERLNRALETSVFTNLYDVGLLQGQIRGITLAEQCIDDAAKQLDLS